MDEFLSQLSLSPRKKIALEDLKHTYFALHPEVQNSPERGAMLLSELRRLESKGAIALPYRQADAPGRPVLVVENHNSFWSFGEWNHNAKRYAAVVYGAGETFRSTGAALGQALNDVDAKGAEYLGDLDPKGILIPQDFNRTSAPDEPKVRPALDLYRWLLHNGRRREKPGCLNAEDLLATNWLGAGLGAELADIWRQGLWIPQEGLGYEQLADWQG